MNEYNDDFYIEEELNELPGYIQSIINDCDTFDKKENSNQIKEKINSDSNIENININDISTEKIQNCPIKNNNMNEKKENDNNNNDNDIDNEINFDDDKENDYKIENIFNSKKDFFNPKISDEKPNLKNDNEYKENINNNIDKKDNNNNNDTKNNSGIKLYCIQENNLLNIKRSYRLQSILQNNISGYQNNTCECSICFRRIQNYGLLSNCDDVFCYDCIKQWRTEAISKNKREMFRRCPICNCESPMLIKSKTYISGEEKRKKFYELKQEKKISQTNQ